MIYLLAALIGYLIGSIPVGYLIGKAHGIDVRRHGSGNIGATNVLRVLGKKWGVFVFFCDAFKGILAVVVATSMGRPEISALNPAILAIVSGIFCILGHNFPVWLAFKGGKGIATSAGVLVALLPLATLIAFVVWVIVFYIWRYVSLASIIAAVFLPIIVWLLVSSDPTRLPLLYFSIAIAALAIWRHRENIKRLIAGTENRFEKGKS